MAASATIVFGAQIEGREVSVLPVKDIEAIEVIEVLWSFNDLAARRFEDGYVTRPAAADRTATPAVYGTCAPAPWCT